MAQLARLQVKRPDVQNVAVTRDVGLQWDRGIGRRRREDDRVAVDELGTGLVLRPEGDLGFLPGVEIESEELVVAADPRSVYDELAVRRIGRCAIAEGILGQVGYDPVLEVDREDVSDPFTQRVEATNPPSGEKDGDSGSSTVFIGMRSSTFWVSTFWTIKLRSFSLRTK